MTPRVLWQLIVQSPADLWKVTSGSGESHSKAAFHDEMSGQGNYEHTAAPVGVTEWSPPAWSWFFDPGYEEPYDRIPGYGSGSLGVAAGSTHNYHGSVTESRKRDWGHQYDTTTTLVDGEWVNTGTGHTFLNSKADFQAVRTVGQTITWAGPVTPEIDDDAEGSLTWTNTQKTTSQWHKEYDGRQDYVLAENTTTHADFWRKTLLTESYHANATATSDFDFSDSWNYHLTPDTSAYGWGMIDLSSSGASEGHRNETFTSHLDIDSKVTTFNTNGTVASVVGTQTWDRTATGTLSWDHDLAQTEVWSWYDPWTEMSATVTTVDQQASESYVNNGSWSKNLATNVPTTISSTLLTTGGHQFHLTHDEYVGTPTEGYLDYENPYDRESTYSYNWSASLPGISGEHGFTPTDLLSMEQQGTLPVSTGWDIGPQGNPEDFGNEEPEPVTYEEPPPETEDQPETWMHFATGFIPVYGSARDMYESYNKGQYGWMVFHGAMLIVDLTGVGALAKLGASAAIKLSVKAGAKILAKTAAKKGIQEIGERGAKAGMKALADGLGEAGSKLLDDAADGAGKMGDELVDAGSEGVQFATVESRLESNLDDYWSYAGGIDLNDARAAARAHGFELEIGRTSRFENARNAVVIGKDDIVDGQVNRLLLAEEIQHGMDRSIHAAARAIRRGLTNQQFHAEVFGRILRNASTHFKYLTAEDLVALQRLINSLNTP